jgi:hypothetical protein
MRLRPQRIVVFLGAAALVVSWPGVRATAHGESEAEKQARLDRFDQGPATIDVSKYPQGIQDNYAVFSRDCTQCHRLSRPINSDFVLPDQWSRYIKRMMYKPGSGISRSDAKQIYDFLVYDASVRKKKELEAKLKALSPEERKQEEQKVKEVVDKYQ